MTVPRALTSIRLAKAGVPAKSFIGTLIRQRSNAQPASTSSITL